MSLLKEKHKKIKTLRFPRELSYFWLQIIWTEVPNEKRYMFKIMTTGQLDKNGSRYHAYFNKYSWLFKVSGSWIACLY